MSRELMGNAECNRRAAKLDSATPAAFALLAM